ncbi:MAG: DUF1820 family protein [Ahniella sp.]|nr:DUF1820 family protein [Ahniella sp.]
MRPKKLYKVTFLSGGKSYELYARTVQSSELWGFTTIADLVFEEPRDSLIIDPAEDRLREEFQHTRALHLPIQAILRIEEVAQRGSAQIRDAVSGEKVTPFPMPPAKPR